MGSYGFQGEPRGNQSSPTAEYEEGYTEKIDCQWGGGGGKKENQNNKNLHKRGSRTSLLALLKSLAHIQQQHPLKIEVVKTSHYLHECRHSTMVVASTKYPPHNTHIM